MLIFLAGFAPGQGVLPASRRVFHAPLTGRKTGATSPNAEMLAQLGLAQLARAIQQLAASSGMGQQIAAQDSAANPNGQD